MKKKINRLVFLIIFILIGIYSYQVHSDTSLVEVSKEVQLKKCVDGDTARFIVNGKDKTVRFLAIDTPETVKPGTPVQPYGKESSELTCSLLTNAKEIELEYEEENKTDKYDRLLAWIWIDGELLQQNLIAEGYAEVKYLYGDYMYTDQLLGVQKYAKEQLKGIWGISN